ncbi:hypothetical protein [Bacillus sp. 3255]|uniref:lipopolysaccharide biosynthesis protein n=1 Tax=Bacillus sp. 3255 TaxID=2817904 RepID=UPI00285C1A67|nr:hypothetical protein [Bacillus sp. 3255]MDR6878340.1 O-antigen/teichoic acid export membrane protein [Bacillus sp. 3255]
MKLTLCEKKIKKFFSDVVINTFAFALLIVAQQIIAFPTIAKFGDANAFGDILALMAIANIQSVFFGESLGNTRLLLNDQYNLEIEYRKLNIILLLLSFILSILMFFMITKSFNLLDVFTFAAISVFSSIRLYNVALFRLNKKFKKILFLNVLYSAGIIVGLGISLIFNKFLMVFFIAELFALVIMNKVKFPKILPIKLSFNKIIIKTYFNLSISSSISYTSNLLDRFIIYPILGAHDVSVFYSASIIGRLGALVINPITGVILSWMPDVNKESRSRILIITLTISSIFAALYFFLIMLFSPMIIKLLYPQYYIEALNYILIICITHSISIVNSLIKPVLLKTVNLNVLTGMNLLYAILIICLGALLALRMGLYGFAIAFLVSTLLITLIRLIYVYIILKKDNNPSQIRSGNQVESGAK